MTLNTYFFLTIFSSVNMDLTMGKMENELLACDSYMGTLDMGKRPFISD